MYMIVTVVWFCDDSNNYNTISNGIVVLISPFPRHLTMFVEKVSEQTFYIM